MRPALADSEGHVIQKDDLRAAGIVTNLRGLLKKKDEVETQELDLNDIVTSTVEIVGPKR
ncbi:MAG: hypothetical protein WBZ35_14355 [Pseudolabrys sp.]